MDYRLSDIFDLQMGKTPDRNNPKYWKDGTEQWISIADLSKCGKYIEKTAECISDTAVLESGIKQIPENTVVMSFKLSIGKLAITPKPMYSNEAIMAFIDRGIVEVDPTYLYFLLLQRDWDEGTNKAVMGKTLNKATLSSVKIKIHTQKEQKEIIQILEKAADIIEFRKQQLAALDTLTKARFVELFGDPEYNKKNWNIVPLGDLCMVGSSKRIYQSEQSSEGIPFMRISDLVNRMDSGKDQFELFIPEKRFEELQTQGLVPKTGDILLTARGTLGRCYIIKQDDKFYFQDGMITWLSKYREDITPLYISYLFEMPGFRKQIDELQAGSTVAYLSIAMAKKLKVMCPSVESQNQFADFVKQVDKSKIVVQKALDEAQLLFDSLMQKCFG